MSRVGGRARAAAARALPRPPRSPRGGSVPRAGLGSLRQLGRFPEARRWVCARACGPGVRGSAPGFFSQVGKSPGPPRARQPRTLGPGTFSLALAVSQTPGAPLRPAPRASPQCPQPPSLLGSLGVCASPLPPASAPDCGTAPPGGYPENLQANRHGPGVPQIWNFIAEGWVTLLHPWHGSPSQVCREVPCWLGSGPVTRISGSGFTLKPMKFKLHSPSVVILC